MRVLVIGCGYLGLRAARMWLGGGVAVCALTRSVERGKQLASEGVQPFVGDVLSPDSLRRIPDADVLLYAVGYDRSAGASKRTVYVDGLQNVLSAIEGRVSRLVYISSSSVYGESAGEWIDETSAAKPQSEGGQICLDAERLLERWAADRTTELTVLRLTGIYGPGRLLARLEDLRRQTPLSGSPDAWLNLIHVDDAAAVAVAAAAHPTPRPLYLATDDRPLQRREFYGALAKLVGAPVPQFDSEKVPRHGIGLNKRCRNALIRELLDGPLTYPTIEEGLPAAVREGDV